jgi:hypothetical protein
MIVDVWDDNISISEESSTYRYTNEFDWRYWLGKFWNIIEIYYVLNLYRRDLESIEESLALAISYEEEISRYE